MLTKLIAAFTGLILLAAILLAYLRGFSPLNRDWVIKSLERRYKCDVQLENFKASLLPGIHITGGGLILKRKGRADLPPLVFVKSFVVEASWSGLLFHPRRFNHVWLQGFVLNIPPRQPQAHLQKERQASAFVLNNVVADGATVILFSANPKKRPLVFDIGKLRLQSAGVGRPMSFQAILVNPKPVGQIQSNGRFGPWDANDPSQTPVSGSYSFRDADLSTIHGLAGILSSQGNYQGVLSEIAVHGQTDTPDFSLGISGNTVRLTTQFSALVDGTNGNTFLRPVNARLLDSQIVARGGVSKVTGQQGRTIQLEVSAKPARLEDLLRLAVKSATPPMTGAVDIETKFDLPPGEKTIASRLGLDGSFSVQSGRFTNPNVEERITSLSRRQPGRENIQNVVANMKGHFVLKNGLMKFSSLSFSIPGVSVHLLGTFGLFSQALDFRGTLRLEAKASQMTTGIKSVLLKPIDPLLQRKGAGTVLPIKITGRRDSPSFGIEIGKVFRRTE